MKKSKVIIPALGVLVLSTAASITGTVAWFTASRDATVSVGEFAVVSTDGNLAATLTAGVGTAVSGTTVSPKQVSSKPIKLGDASFNPATHQLWNNKGNSTSSFVTVGNTTSHSTADSGSHAWMYSSGKVYHAVSWKVTLTYTWGEDFTTLNIFFNYDTADTEHNSTMTGSKQTDAESATDKTYEGYRIALICGSREIVYAGLKNSSAASEVKTVTGASATGATSSVADTVVYKDSTLTRAEDGDANQTSRADYLGQITHTTDAESNSVDIWCVAWYEGTDPKVVNDNEMDQVSARLGFYGALNA